MQISNTGYPEGTDLSYFDDAPENEIKTALGEIEVNFNFKCPHCDNTLVVDACEFDLSPVIEDDCYHCGNAISLEITEEQFNFINKRA